MEPKYTFNYSQKTSTAALKRCHSELSSQYPTFHYRYTMSQFTNCERHVRGIQYQK